LPPISAKKQIELQELRYQLSQKNKPKLASGPPSVYSVVSYKDDPLAQSRSVDWSKFKNPFISQ